MHSIYDDDMGRMQWLYGVYDLSVCEIIARLLSAGDFALDVGANVGKMTLLMSRRVGPHGWVDCYEPHPTIYKLLATNARHSGRSNIYPHDIAIGSKDEEVRLSIPPEFAQNIGLSSVSRNEAPGAKIIVAARSLDSIYGSAPVIDLMKLDVEGHEAEVLKGASLLLKRRAFRAIIFENVNPSQLPVVNMLLQYGCLVFGISAPELLLTDPLCGIAGVVSTNNCLALRA